MITNEERSLIEQYFNRIGLLTVGNRESFCAKATGWAVADSNELAKVMLSIFVHDKIHKYMEEYDDFTISILPETYCETLARFRNQPESNMKLALETSLTIAEEDGFLTYKEAEIALFCHKLFSKNPNKMGDLIFSGQFEHEFFIAELVKVVKPFEERA